MSLLWRFPTDAALSRSVRGMNGTSGEDHSGINSFQGRGGVEGLAAWLAALLMIQEPFQPQLIFIGVRSARNERARLLVQATA
jgi:hypothetical protein